MVAAVPPLLNRTTAAELLDNGFHHLRQDTKMSLEGKTYCNVVLEYVHRQLGHLGDVVLGGIEGRILRVIEHVAGKACPVLIYHYGKFV